MYVIRKSGYSFGKMMNLLFRLPEQMKSQA
jgi:hypothetical protein